MARLVAVCRDGEEEFPFEKRQIPLFIDDTLTVNGLKREPFCLKEPYQEEVKDFLINEDELHLFDDLTKVNPVTTATVLKCLQARYAREVFYTNAGCTLVAINPFQFVFDLYSPELMREYHTAPRPWELKPHIFIEAEQAYRNVQCQIEPVNQSIIVSGESGAGKTWTSRCLMKFYATVAAASSSPVDNNTVGRIERRVLDSNPVMEAFGNACTLRNNNSSRFGKYIQLQLNGTQLLTGASVQTYLLEKTRVAHQAPRERNFHIFYQITKGASKNERQEWNLPAGANFSWLPNSEGHLEEDCFEITKDAMLHLGIDRSAQNNIFKILSGLLHLGNIQFSDSVDESQPCDPQENAKDFIMTTAALLRVSEEELLEKLRVRTITAGRQQQVFRKPCSRSECGMRRDCLAKVIYARLFDWLVTVINRSICADFSTWTNFIGLLDVYGFEAFPENNLEQLCINYANEKLQQHFVAHYLKAQQEEYTAEGLAWSFISYQDNQSCVNLIEGSPASIFSLLNEECRLNRPSNASQFQSRIEKALSSSPCISRDKFSKTPHFIVSHYAGRVSYQLEDMVEKNKDPVPAELIQLLQDSQDCLIQKLFPVEEGQTDNKTQNRAPVLTVVSKFKGSLERLMHVLNSTAPHYIRCIKPNMDCQAMTFKKEEVLSQLEACGIVETINISAAGFPIRMPFQSFMQRYALMRPTPSKSGAELYVKSSPSAKKKRGLGTIEENHDTLRCVVHEMLKTLVPEERAVSLLHSKAEVAPSNALAHCGKTKVFMTHSTLELLEAKRASVLWESAFCIQCCWRTYRCRKTAKQKRAASLIQAAVRAWLTRIQIKRMHRAASAIKQAWRKWKAKMNTLAVMELDDMDVDKPISLLPASPVRAPLLSANGSLDKTWTLSAIMHSWPLGLVLSAAPVVRKAVSMDGLHRNSSFLQCLKVLHHHSGFKVDTSRSVDGITSIRALPQGSVRFRYKKSPLLYANVCPETHSSRITGFNEILLEKTK